MSETKHFRADIQGLRAVAVLLVAIFHLWPRVLPGGYVGVDIFFAISGFLITGLLLREIQETGRISLPAFWARRARRLLPAALLVLLVTAIATYYFSLRTHWNQFYAEIQASTIYLENGRLAADAVDYWAPQSRSPVQHYWSLSIEEQFYFIWPVLMALAVTMGSVSIRIGRKRSLVPLFSGVTALSFAYCLLALRFSPRAAYFHTAARAWEFGIGGMLALWDRPTKIPPVLRAIISWAGMLSIAFAAFAYSNRTAFPGYAALLPVTGALAVIWANGPESLWAPASIMKCRPIQFIGDISYSIYLWHWPPIILLPEVIGRTLDTRARFSLFAATLFAAWLTKIFIEDPIRNGTILSLRRPRITFAITAAGMATVVGTSVMILKSLENYIARSADVTQLLLDKNPPCLGAAARDLERPCRNPEFDNTVIPAPMDNWDQAHYKLNSGLVEQTGPLEVVEIGVPAAEAASTFAIVGDSHAPRLQITLEAIAQAKHWRGYLIWACPVTFDVTRRPGPNGFKCVIWNRQLLLWLSLHPEVETVFTTSYNDELGMRTGVDPEDGNSFVAAYDPETRAKREAGFIREWRAMPRSVKHIVVIRDNPQNLKFDCVEKALERDANPRMTCFDSRSEALLPDVAAEAAVRMSRAGVIDLTSFYCDSESCYHVIGGVRVYSDSNHISRVFARTLTPYFMRELNALLAMWKRRPVTALGGNL